MQLSISQSSGRRRDVSWQQRCDVCGPTRRSRCSVPFFFFGVLLRFSGVWQQLHRPPPPPWREGGRAYTRPAVSLSFTGSGVAPLAALRWFSELFKWSSLVRRWWRVRLVSTIFWGVSATQWQIESCNAKHEKWEIIIVASSFFFLLPFWLSTNTAEDSGFWGACWLNLVGERLLGGDVSIAISMIEWPNNRWRMQFFPVSQRSSGARPTVTTNQE